MTDLLTALGALNKVVGILKSAKDLLPSGDDKKKIEAEIERSEQELKLAEVEMAKGFNYPLCKCTFPPNIMLFQKEDGNYKCQSCNATAVYIQTTDKYYYD